MKSRRARRFGGKPRWDLPKWVPDTWYNHKRWAKRYWIYYNTLLGNMRKAEPLLRKDKWREDIVTAEEKLRQIEELRALLELGMPPQEILEPLMAKIKERIWQTLSFGKHRPKPSLTSEPNTSILNSKEESDGKIV